MTRFERLLADLRCAASVKEEAQLAPEPSQTRDPKKDSLFVVPLAAFALQRCVDSDGRGRTVTHVTVVFPVVFPGQNRLRCLAAAFLLGLRQHDRRGASRQDVQDR